MFNDILEYGKAVLADKYIEVPFDILSNFSSGASQVYLKIDLAQHGFSQSLPIEKVSLDHAMELMQTATNDAEFVYYTLNYMAIRNPYIKTEIFEFLEGC